MTRRSTDIWLIGQQIDKLNQTKLPIKKDVMALLMHYKHNKNLIDRKALTATVNDVIEIWQGAGIVTTQKCNVIKKLGTFYKEWIVLKKSKGKNSVFGVQKEIMWQEKLEELFDIAHAKANELITIDEDRVPLYAYKERVERVK